MKRLTKEQILDKIIECAKKYQENLEGKVLLVLYHNKKENKIDYIELHFHARNFLHLTGVDLKDKYFKKDKNDIPSVLFYKKCLSETDRLTVNHFNLSKNGIENLKLAVLPTLLESDLSSNMIGDFLSSKPKLITNKLTGNTQGCLGFVIDSSTQEYVPNTILKEDVRRCTKPTNRIIAIFRKQKNEETYTEFTYIAKNKKKNEIKWNHIKFPKEFTYLLDTIKYESNK